MSGAVLGRGHCPACGRDTSLQHKAVREHRNSNGPCPGGGKPPVALASDSRLALDLAALRNILATTSPPVSTWGAAAREVTLTIESTFPPAARMSLISLAMSQSAVSPQHHAELALERVLGRGL